MAEIHPFRALRPPQASAAAIASVPYDVVDTEEARALAAGSSLSFLHVIRPEIDLEAGIDLHSDEVYAAGREALQRHLETAQYVEEDEPSLYVYRLNLAGRDQTGVVGCCSVDEYDDNRILKHERTRQDKEDDRTRHVVEMRCQAEPIFLCHRDSPEVDALVADVVQGEPLYDFVAADGVRHTLWRVPWPEAFVHAYRSITPLYVADGHHRSASASRARAHFRARNPVHSGHEEYNRVLATVFPASQLRILPYNRVVLNLGGLTVDAFLAELEKLGPVLPTADHSPSRRGQFCLCLPGGNGPRWFSFHLSPAEGASVIDTLDVSLLQDRVLAPLLGIDDQRTSKRIDFVGGVRGTKELERLVAEGRASAAFSLFPTSLDELMSVSDAGLIMPPKSTWFEPKLRSGLFLHAI